MLTAPTPARRLVRAKRISADESRAKKKRYDADCLNRHDAALDCLVRCNMNYKCFSK
jgi:hypothetical protein